MNAPQDLSDFRRLLDEARNGDDAAMHQLIMRYESEVRLVARHQLSSALRPHMDSMDVVQSVHGTLITGLRQGKHDILTPENLVGLAVTMVRRKVIDHWRHLKRQQRLSRGGTTKDSVCDLFVSLQSQEDDAESSVALRETVEKLIVDLNESEQQLIELRLLGYSTAEAAREMGQNADVLRVRLSRLREKCRALGIRPESI